MSDNELLEACNKIEQEYREMTDSELLKDVEQIERELNRVHSDEELLENLNQIQNQLWKEQEEEKQYRQTLDEIIAMNDITAATLRTPMVSYNCYISFIFKYVLHQCKIL